MRAILILFCCLFFAESNGQKVYKYYIYMSNSSYKPTFVNQGNYSVYAGSSSGKQSFFNNYQIISFDKAFTATNLETFSRVLLLKTTSSTLAADLLANFPSEFIRFDDLTDEVLELTSYPNDYGTSTPANNTPQTGAPIFRKDLDYINVAKAWDISTGINTSTGVRTKLGLSDARIKTDDPDFINKVTLVGNNYSQTLTYDPGPTGGYTAHGTGVGAIAAARGNNGYGSTGVCYDCDIVKTDPGYNDLLLLAQSGVRVINMSWAYMSNNPYIRANDPNNINQKMIDMLVNDYKIVLVASAGNQNSYQTTADKHCGTAFTGIQYGFPASYEGVISVSVVQYKNPLVLPLTTSSPGYSITSSLPNDCINYLPVPNTILYLNIESSFGESINGFNPNVPSGLIYNGWCENCPNGSVASLQGLQVWHTSNPEVDILAPSASTFRHDIFAEQNGLISMTGGGTSASAPFVAGTAALMITANTCLIPDEVDDILKLTSNDVEALSYNQIFAGQIGAGSLNAGDAVEFVNEMKKINGTAVIDNHIFNRFNFKLEKINNNLKIENATFKDNCVANFTARTQINLKPGTNLKPNATGSVNLKINPAIVTTCTPVVFNRQANTSDNNSNLNARVLLFPNPNNGVFELNINNINELQNKTVAIDILDINGRIVYKETVVTENNNNFSIPLNVASITTGLYFVKLSSAGYVETVKFIKK